MTAVPIRQRQTLEAEVIDVTPAMAAKWLDVNPSNRTIRIRNVNRFAADMHHGHWRMTGESIKFAPDGTLLDGQHRLRAVIASNVTVPMVVMFNIDPAAQNVMDTGAARTAADQLSIAEMKNPTLLASASRWVILFERGQLYIDRTAQQVTHSDINEFVHGNDLFIDIVNTLTAGIRRSVDMPPSTAAASYYLCAKVSRPAADEFIARVVDGAGLPTGSSILALRNTLRSLKDKRQRVYHEVYLSLTIRAWNAWRADQKLNGGYLHTNNSAGPIRCPVPR